MEEKIKVNSLKAWFLGIRPTSLGASLMTVLLGTGLAHSFNSDLFYQPRGYIAECYRAGTVLAA